jgi:hypothetical protein
MVSSQTFHKDYRSSDRLRRSSKSPRGLTDTPHSNGDPPPPCVLCNHHRNHRFFHRIRIRHTRLRTSVTFQSVRRRFRRLSSRNLSFYAFFTRFRLPHLAKWPPDVANSALHALHRRRTRSKPLWTLRTTEMQFPMMEEMNSRKGRTETPLQTPLQTRPEPVLYRRTQHSTCRFTRTPSSFS